MDPREKRFEDDKARAARWLYLTEERDYEKANIPEHLRRHRRICTELVLDNMALAIAQNGQGLFEATILADIPVFTTFAYPMVRDVFFKLIANEIVSVQPMTGPTGRIHYRHTMYGTTRSAVTEGDRVDQVFDSQYGAGIAAGSTVPEINSKIESLTVTAESRKLRAAWPIEVQQDISSQYGLDMGSEMMGDLTGEIAREIDRDVVEDILAGATAGNVNWSSAIPGSGPYSTIDPKVYKNTLYDALVDANDLVFKKRYRNATWIVAGPDECARLEKLENFKLIEGADDAMRNIGIIRFGSLASRWTVYKDPLFQAGKILLGYRGPSWLETGYVYSPYIPMWVTPLFTDPATFNLTRGIMSRYGKKVVVGDFYSTVTITSS